MASTGLTVATEALRVEQIVKIEVLPQEPRFVCIAGTVTGISLSYLEGTAIDARPVDTDIPGLAPRRIAGSHINHLNHLVHPLYISGIASKDSPDR
jgi:hypothetical protein